jgi:acetyl/propionyl-CoA carboxylase alpha subunit
MPMFYKVLVANRGEIACRVIRTCRRLGIRSVAVYSEADANAPHVRMADEAHSIGPAPALESYLNIDRIVAVAQSSGAEAVHPGYGFLSENPKFAEAVIAAGLVFIGPPPDATRALGTKTGARKLVEKDGVPTIPWTHLQADDPAKAEETARSFGYPVVVKPSAGGGGIVTIIVRSPEELPHAVELAESLGKRFFNQPMLHMEKFVERARHVETQVMVDRAGGVIVFPERECSIQRRYQKVIEESPSHAVSPLLRGKLAEAAVKVMKAGGYFNVGTVECLVDAAGAFYFLEVNSRIQVEHPVTEMITGLDIVELQLRVASGHRLAVSPEQLRANGHAIEARIYAESPETLLPTGGLITEYREPFGEHIRVDSGVCSGYEVTSHYDPLLAKLVTWGATREAAVQRMREALREYEIEGVVTNIPLLMRIFGHRSFLSAEYHTGTLAAEFVAQPSAPGAPLGLSEWWRFGR